MNEHNYRRIKAEEFLKIIQGEAGHYIGPARSSQKYSWGMTNKAMREDGLDPEINVTFPILEDRQKERVKYHLQSVAPREYWPDFEDYLIQVIEGHTYLNRGYNTNTGEGSKPELDYGIDLANCYFSSTFSLRNVKSKGPLLLSNCRFIKSQRQDYRDDRFLIEKCKFKRVVLNGISSIEGETFFSLFLLKISGLEVDSLLIESCNINSLSFQETISNIKEVSVRRSNLDTVTLIDINSDECEFFESNIDMLRIECIDNNIKKIVIEKTNIKSLIVFELGANELTLRDCKVNKVHIICDINKLSKLKIINSEISKIKIEGSQYESCVIDRLRAVKFFILDAQFKNFFMSLNNFTGSIPVANINYDIDNLKLEFTNQTDKGEYIFRGIKINKLTISGMNNSSILFKSCSISQSKIVDFSNLSDIRFHNIYNVNRFVLTDASIGKAELTNYNINVDSLIKIIRSNISDIVLSNTSLNRKIEASNQTDHRGLREIYRQLKLAANKQSNRIQELGYEALEMDAYAKDDSAKTFSDRFILFTNKWSNNHGQSWIRAFLWLLLFNITFYCLIKFSLGYTVHFGKMSVHELREYAELTFNPLHDFNKVFEIYFTNGSPFQHTDTAKLIDIISKVCSGYFLFQLLRAFRKYVK